VSDAASEKAKGASEQIALNKSIVDRPSEREKEDITRWKSG
jgi:hypothetical protein